MKESDLNFVMKPGYIYVLPTKFEDLYDIQTALYKGTLFKQLDLPYNVYGK